MTQDNLNPTKIIFGYNQLLAAASLTEGGEFNLFVFEDFNKLVEAVVLYDRVVLLGDYDFPSSNIYDELTKKGFLKSFLT